MKYKTRNLTTKKSMKRILWLSISLLLALGAAAQTQQGYVKTKGRRGSDGAVVPGQRISGATVQVKGRSAMVTQANGVFSFPIPANKFYIQSVKKQGYVITDPELLTRQYVYSTNPLILVLETPEQKTDCIKAKAVSWSTSATRIFVGYSP